MGNNNFYKLYFVFKFQKFCLYLRTYIISNVISIVIELLDFIIILLLYIVIEHLLFLN